VIISDPELIVASGWRKCRRSVLGGRSSLLIRPVKARMLRAAVFSGAEVFDDCGDGCQAMLDDGGTNQGLYGGYA
jgi:hypothetical protein